MKIRHYRENWWTRERVINGLRRFYRDFKTAPTSTEVYQRHQQFTGGNANGVGNPYPSSYGVLKYFNSFRQAWTEAGIEVDRSYEPWSEDEERFLGEAIGILSRKEIAEVLDRTPNAVHRRIYDLGLHSYKSQGWTFHRVMRVTGVPDYILRRYTDRGELPYFRGSKCCYLDPADLLIVKEIDWEHPPAELAFAVRQSLMNRLVAVLKRQDWRLGRLYQPHIKNKTGKRHKRNLVPPCPKPSAIDKGDWVKVKNHPDLRDRVGYVHTVYWSQYANQSSVRRSTGHGSWVARVEFKKEKNMRRLNRTLPLEMLALTTDNSEK